MKKRVCIIAFALACLPACEKGPSEKPATAVTESTAPAATNRIDIPAIVRRNLGITFATVEARNVARTIRVPGRFELSPEARREYLGHQHPRAVLRAEQDDARDHVVKEGGAERSRKTHLGAGVAAAADEVDVGRAVDLPAAEE